MKPDKPDLLEAAKSFAAIAQHIHHFKVTLQMV
jgi:hypothetical protein